MASINVVNADEDTEKSTNPDQFANIRTGDPAQENSTGPEADAKLEETASVEDSTDDKSTSSASESDSSDPTEAAETSASPESPAETPVVDEAPAEATPMTESPAAEEPAPAGPDPEPTPEASKPEPAAAAAAGAGAVTAAKVTSGTGKKDKHLGRLLFELFLVLVILGLGYWGYSQKQEVDKLTTENKNLVAENSKLNSNPAVIAQKESDTILLAVGKLVKLPAGETPTIANVTDAAAAKKQSAFFVNAQNGDKVLFYVKSGQAILYRPSTNTIVAQGPLTLNNTSTSTNKKQ